MTMMGWRPPLSAPTPPPAYVDSMPAHVRDRIVRAQEEALAAQIRAYWQARGRDVKVCVVRDAYSAELRGYRYRIVSDLVFDMRAGLD